jgi:predicted dehydrogenase
MKKIRMGVIGTGSWATQHHIPSLIKYDRAELVVISDVDKYKLKAVSSYYSLEHTYQNYKDMLDLVDGVVIAVPHVHHYEIARDALNAGVSVLIEKPMTLESNHAWDLVKIAEERNLHLMVGTTFQFTRHARRIRDVVRSGHIGEVMHISGLFASSVEPLYRNEQNINKSAVEPYFKHPDMTTYSDPRIAGGGQGQTQLSHAMGMVFWITDLYVTELFAYMEKFDLQVDLVNAISYRLNNGAVGTMAGTGNVGSGQDENQEFRYYGTEGQIRQDMIHGKAEIFYKDGRVERLSELTNNEIYPEHIPSRTLVDLLLGMGDNPAPGRSAARVVEFLEAAYRSAELGFPVKLTP